MCAKPKFHPIHAGLAGAVLLLAGCAERPEPIAYGEPGAAQEYYLRKRVPPGRDLPVERYAEARRRMRTMPVFSAARGRWLSAKDAGRREMSLGDWTSLGPGNVGGRTRALVINPVQPAVMYAAGVAGGVWKTTGGGQSWAPLDDLMSNLAVNALAIDPRNPDTLYAGTGEGLFPSDGVRGLGIFKTVDAGATWKSLPATENSSFWYVNKIAISPVDPQRIYAATYGGIWRSLDGGVTWARTLSRVSPQNGCQDLVIRIDQSPNDYLFAACGHRDRQATIFRNKDAGGAALWVPVHTEKNMSRTSLALAPSDQSVIYALTASFETGDLRNAMLAVYRSTKDGDPDTWEARVRNTDETRLNTALLSNPLSLFGDVCSNGEKVFSNQGWYDNTIAVDPTDSRRVWAGGIDLFRSDDGGANWGLASYWWADSAHADQHGIVFHPGYDGGANQVVFSINDGGIYKSVNAAAGTAAGARAACVSSNTKVRWAALNNSYGVTQFYHGSVYPGGHIYMGGAQDNGTQVGADVLGANSWLEALGGDGGYSAVHPKDANTIYLESQRLSLRKSTDGGNTSSRVTTGITEAPADFPFIVRFLLDPNDPEKLWLGGRILWRSVNGAASWTQAAPPLMATGTETETYSALAVAPGDSDRVLAGTNTGRILRTFSASAANKATPWDPFIPRTGFVSSIQFDPSNADTVYATYSSFDDIENRGHVFKSSNGGVTWNSIDGRGNTGLPDLPVHTIVIDPDNPAVLYAGTDLGIFVSTDGGDNWGREESRFPNTVVDWLAIDRGGGGSTLVAFTHGRGAWRVRLGGAPPCVYDVSAPKAVVGRAAGEAEVSISTASDCAWSSITTVGWGVPSPANGVGPATVKFKASANTSGRARQGGWVIADKFVTVDQLMGDN